MKLWIPKQLKGSLESAASNLGKRSPHFPEAAPEVLNLDPPSASRGGLWVLWPHTPANLRSLGVEDEVFRRGLESLVEVEYRVRTFEAGSFLERSALPNSPYAWNWEVYTGRSGMDQDPTNPARAVVVYLR